MAMLTECKDITRTWTEVSHSRGGDCQREQLVERQLFFWRVAPRPSYQRGAHTTRR